MIADFLRSLLGVSLTGGIFILAAFLVRAGMKQRLPKHFLVLLWAAVLLHLLFITGKPSPTSIYNYVVFRSPVSLDEPSAPVRGATPEAAVDAIAGLQIDAGGAVRESGRGVYVAAFYVWLAGAAGFLAIFVGSYWSTRRRFGDAFLLKNNTAVNGWLAGKKFPPRVYVSDRTTTPLSYGLFRPRIVLPREFDLSNAQQLESVLEHEYIHGRNYHNVMKVLVYFAVILHWFNPLVWLYWFLFDHDLELACDERVIRAIGPGRRAEYAHSLVAVAERAVVPFPLASAFSARNLKERIVDVMGYKRTTVSLLAAEIVLVAVLFALFGTTSVGNAVTSAPVASASTERDTGDMPPELAAWTYPEGIDPRSAALSAFGGGTVIKQEIDTGKNGIKYKYRIISGGNEYEIHFDPHSRSVVKYERKRMKKIFTSVDFSKFISMERAVREALDHLGGGTATECEIKRVKPNRFIYQVEVVADGREREVEIDAFRGGVLSVKDEGKRPRQPKPSKP